MKKQPRDHVRLARAFDLPPTRLGAAAWTSGIFTLFGLANPFLLIPVGGVAVGLGAMTITDRRAIEKWLREVDHFGFPVTGYRAWLLAESPALDIELRRDVDVEIVRTSTATVDPAITVDKTSARVFRFVMRRIALPNVKAHLPPIEVGDRRMLGELYHHILAPLHADVGIVRMQMGDRATLPPLVAAARGEDEPVVTDVVGLGAFRESAMAAPPALQALVDLGGERELPHEARRLTMRSERVMHAASASPSGAGTVVAIGFGGMTAGAQFGPTGAFIGVITGLVLGVTTVISGNRQSAKSLARAVSDQGYPIVDYDDWLLSGRPLFDIETARPIPRDWFLAQLARLSAWSVTKNAMVPWVEDLIWFGDSEVRVETRPSYIQPPTSRIEPFYGGSHDMFRRFMVEVLAPLHARARIQIVRMGGYVDRRI